MDTDGGGWTVFQRRQDGSVNFDRTWNDFRDGFGDLTGEHWLGNKYVHEMTFNGRAYDLRIDLADWEGEERHATYSFVTVDYERNHFRLDYDRYVHEQSTVVDSFAFHNGMNFTTVDRDNDRNAANCGDWYGGFWHNSCVHAGLNNRWRNTSEGAYQNRHIYWIYWRGVGYSLKSTKMMIRPID